MLFALVGLGIISVVELLLWLSPLWSHRKLISQTLAVGLTIGCIALLAIRLSPWTVVVSVISLYRVINLARIVANRIKDDHLYYVARQTTGWLIAAQLIVVTLAALNHHYHIDAIWWWSGVVVLQLATAIILLSSTIRHLRTTKPPQLTAAMKDAALPTLTVAIPARNETTDLEACLQSLVTSSYPKLEILVLDDCSQNKRTPEIIREFAHNGVRFVAGTPPPAHWLAKNYAYSQLAEAANGELLLFCGVDTRFQPESLTLLVKTLLQKKKTMLSVMPINLHPASSNPVDWFWQPNRYAWELALPRRLVERPPVLSTCWLITRQALEATGGFAAVQRKGVPESYFARATAADHDGYSFMQSDNEIGVSCQKTPEEQRDTAIRTRYLQLHRRPELIALVGMLELAILVWPLIILGAALLSQQWVLVVLNGATSIMITAMYSRIFDLTYRRFLLKGTWLMPLAALYDIGLLNYSMWQYEFGEVLWKGRNVCIPLMQVVPQLPK